MKILMVNKFYYIKGGSETYYFSLKRKLEEDGHVVIDFSMNDDKNYESQYSNFFVENVDYSGRHSVFSKIKIAKNIVYSNEAKRKFECLVKQEKPDIVHLHIFQHQISPSILDICKKYNIPTVYTAHDLKMICLNYKMMHHGKICEDCKDGRLYHCVLNKCVKDSVSKSLINVCEGYFHKWRKSYDAIDFIITPSDFYRQKFMEFGVSENKVIHIPNFLERDNPNVNIFFNSKRYYLYFGRLSEEKGILTLISVMNKIGADLYIVGSGPLKETIEEYISLNNASNIKLLGFKSGQDLIDIVGNAKAVILPSEWYENGPFSAIEALQLGIPIIGANIGGIPELIDSNGVLFDSGDFDDLNSKIMQFERMSNVEYERFCSNSRLLFNRIYTWNYHKKKIYNVYDTVLGKKKSSYNKQ